LSDRDNFLDMLGRIRHARVRASGWPTRVRVRRDVHAMLAANYQTKVRQWCGMVDGIPCIVDDELLDEFEVEVDADHDDGC
jgi:hypothetical protein